MKKTITLENGQILSVRKIKGADYDAVMTFLDEFSRGKGARWTNQYPGQPKRNKDASMKLYESSDALFLGIWNQKKLIGFGSLILGGRAHPRNVLTGEFGITLLEEYTSCGLGSFIMSELIKWAKKEKVHRIQGMVFHENVRALGLYKKLGFEIEGMAHEIAKYQNKWQHAYYIAKILD